MQCFGKLGRECLTNRKWKESREPRMVGLLGMLCQLGLGSIINLSKESNWISCLRLFSNIDL
jgi:hypothetical protein